MPMPSRRDRARARAKISLDLATQQMRAATPTYSCPQRPAGVPAATIGLSWPRRIAQRYGGAVPGARRGWWNRADVPSAETNDPVPLVGGAPELLVPVN
jgi:hypothetical protein